MHPSIKFGLNILLLLLLSFEQRHLQAEAFVITNSPYPLPTFGMNSRKRQQRHSPACKSNQMYLDFHDEPIIISQEKYNQVLKWAFDNKSQPLTIQKSSIGHGHGLYLLQPLPKNTVIFKIPASKCLTLQASKSHPTLGESLEIMEQDLGDEFGPIAILAAYLASEMLREQCAEWEEDESLKGLHGPFIDILPTGRAVSQQDHVLWWSEKEVKDLFTGGAAHEKATALREWVEEEGSIIEGMLVSDLAQKNMGLSISQVRGAVTNAFVNVLSRSFFVGESGAQRLVPILDMCQHSNSPNVDYKLDHEGNVVVRTNRQINAGEELTACYYSTEFEGHEFYVMYGFVVPYAEPERVLTPY